VKFDISISRARGDDEKHRALLAHQFARDAFDWARVLKERQQRRNTFAVGEDMMFKAN